MAGTGRAQGACGNATGRKESSDIIRDLAVATRSRSRRRTRLPSVDVGGLAAYADYLNNCRRPMSVHGLLVMFGRQATSSCGFSNSRNTARSDHSRNHGRVTGDAWSPCSYGFSNPQNTARSRCAGVCTIVSHMQAFAPSLYGFR